MYKCGHCGAQMKKAMAKCAKCGKAMKKSSSSGTTEASLMKALEDLEKAAIPKELRDADGGFATEGDGDELQVSADENAEGAAKKVKKGGDEDSDEASADEDSGEDMEMSKKGKSVKKAKGKSDDEEGEEHSPAETSSPELSADDDEESIGEAPKAAKSKKAGKSTKKSLKKSMMEDEVNAETIEASSFVESLVDSCSDAMEGLTKSIDSSRASQQDFNTRLAKAVKQIGDICVMSARETYRLRKALARIPDTGRGKTVLSKADVQERQFQEQGDGGEALDEATFRKAIDTISTLAMSGKVAPSLVTEFELKKSLDVFSPEIRQMIMGGLH